MVNRPDGFVLYVEDNPDDVDLTVIAFKARNFPHPIKIARDGAEALEFLFGTGRYHYRDKAETPVLILLDLKLPKVQGLEVLKRIRADQLLKHIVVVILTSSNEERDRASADILGANLYMQKPVNYGDFQKVAERIESLVSVACVGNLRPGR